MSWLAGAEVVRDLMHTSRVRATAGRQANASRRVGLVGAMSPAASQRNPSVGGYQHEPYRKLVRATHCSRIAAAVSTAERVGRALMDAASDLLGGVERTCTRPRGFISWSPRAMTLELRGQVRAVLAEYADYLPLTVRQIFYRLVGSTGYDKTERAYGRLCEHLVKARETTSLTWQSSRRAEDTAGLRAPPNRWRRQAWCADQCAFGFTDHHGIVPSFAPVNVPVGPSGPSSATRTAWAAPSSTVSVPS
jgi:hypothetical protein